MLGQWFEEISTWKSSWGWLFCILMYEVRLDLEGRCMLLTVTDRQKHQSMLSVWICSLLLTSKRCQPLLPYCWNTLISFCCLTQNGVCISRQTSVHAEHRYWTLYMLPFSKHKKRCWAVAQVTPHFPCAVTYRWTAWQQLQQLPPMKLPCSTWVHVLQLLLATIF